MNKFAITFGISIAILALFALVLFKFWLIAANIAGGFLLYFMIDTFLDFLERKGIRGFPAYLVLAIVSATILTSFILFVSIPLVDETKALVVQLPELTQQINQKVMELSSTFPFILEAQETAKQRIASSAQSILLVSKDIITGVLTMLLIAAILLASRGTLHQTFTEKIPNEYFEVAVGLTHRIVEHVKSFAVAKIVETIIVAILYFIGFWAIGMPHALLLSTLGGILNIIPYIGPLITVVPVGIAAWLAGGYPLLGLAVLVVAIAQLIDNSILQTWLISKFVDVNPLVVVVITIIAAEIAGVVGMVIAIPVYAIAKIIIGGVYDYLRAVQRHEKILREEERYHQHDAGKNQHKIKPHILGAH